jgi:hypothetical protein
MVELGTTTVKLRKLTKQMTLTIHLVETNEFKIRRWMALTLIKWATLVLGCGLKVED